MCCQSTHRVARLGGEGHMDHTLCVLQDNLMTTLQKQRSALQYKLVKSDTQDGLYF